jgi:hypothetical protein
MIDDFGGEVLFGGAVDVGLWSNRLSSEACEVVWHRFRGNRKSPPLFTRGESNAPYVPLVLKRGKTIEPVTSRSRFARGTTVAMLIDTTRTAAAGTNLGTRGWVPVPEG